MLSDTKRKDRKYQKSAMPLIHDPVALARERQAVDDTPRPVVATITEYPGGHFVSWHRHARAQLLYACAGVMTVWTDRGMWVVPPHRAVWVPGGVAHQAKMSGAVSMRSLYIDPAVRADLPAESCVLTVPPLLRELILHAVTRPRLYDEAGPDGRIMAVILDRIRVLPVLPLHLPLPRDRRLLSIAEALMSDPADKTSLEDWGRKAGASSRTLARLFRAEVNMSFRTWRQHARLLEALRRLAQGQPVTTVALDVGFATQSAFIEVFKRVLGQTPGRYFTERQSLLSDSTRDR